jgi:hypothetical protein
MQAIVNKEKLIKEHHEHILIETPLFPKNKMCNIVKHYHNDILGLPTIMVEGKRSKFAK